MVCNTYLSGNSILHRTDPRLRILFCAVFCITVSMINTFSAAVTAISFSMLSATAARISPRILLRRLMPVNLFFLLLAAILPFSFQGEALFSMGPLNYTLQGFRLFMLVALKGNAVILSIIVYIGTMDIIVFGHGLSHLKVPEKFIHLFLFTVRYIDVLYREIQRLLRSAKARAFQPRINIHTFRIIGNIAGMLLVRSLERSARIVRSMKCRGFDGTFYLLDHFTFTSADWIRAAILSGCVAAIILTEVLSV